MAENFLASIFWGLAVQELFRVCHCIFVQLIMKLKVSLCLSCVVASIEHVAAAGFFAQR